MQRWKMEMEKTKMNDEAGESENDNVKMDVWKEGGEDVKMEIRNQKSEDEILSEQQRRELQPYTQNCDEGKPRRMEI